MTRIHHFRVLSATFAGALAAPLLAGFGSTETFLPAVGRVPGQGGAQFYTTVWATNLTAAPQTMTFRFLKQGQANGSPPSFVDTLQPGETKVYENVVESKLGLANAIGAARVTSTGEIFVSERIFNQAPGADLGNTEGLFFAGVPKSFSISAGQSASIQGIDQGGSENFRYNFALVETGGGSPTVNVQVFDGSGTMLGQKVYSLLPYEQLQPGVGDVVAAIKTTNARITATVTGGTGSVLLAGAQLANQSQDSSGFEMTFRDELLGSGGTAGVTSLNGLTGAVTLTPGSGISITPSGSSISIAYTGGGGAGGITSVTHDASLSGAGTGASPLGIANGQVVRSVNGLHDNLTLAAGSNVTITPSGSTLTIASSGGGGGALTLPFSGSVSSTSSAFAVGNSGSGDGIFAQALSSNDGVHGYSNSGSGIHGEIGQNGVAAVLGNSANSIGVEGLSGSYDGVYGISQSTGPGGTGVYGTSHGQSFESGWAGVWGDSHNATGVYGTSVNDRGVLGITSSASAAAAVEGLNHASAGVGVLGRVGSGSGVGALGTGVWGDAPSSGSGVTGTSSSGPGVNAFSAGTTALRAENTGSGDIAEFFGIASAIVARIDRSGKGFFDGGTQTGGADVAEFISGSGALSPGDVVEIDVDRPGEFRLSSHPNSTAVAGVISTDPGVSMNGRGGANSPRIGPELALAGRVPVKVTVEGGRIRPGDLLVAASRPGHAMRAPAVPLPGTIIGKALGALPEGEGLIEMLVMLR